MALRICSGFLGTSVTQPLSSEDRMLSCCGMKFPQGAESADWALTATTLKINLQRKSPVQVCPVGLISSPVGPDSHRGTKTNCDRQVWHSVGQHVSVCLLCFCLFAVSLGFLCYLSLIVFIHLDWQKRCCISMGSSWLNKGSMVWC